jgi:hypothetical protein
LWESEFVEVVRKASEEAMERRYRLRAEGFDLERIIERVAEIKIGEVTGEDTKLLKKHVGDFGAYFGFDLAEILKKPFTKIYPYSHRPYGTIYAY